MNASSFAQTTLRLCDAAKSRWEAGDRLLKHDVPSVLSTASRPEHYWHRMVLRDLVACGQRTALRAVN